MATHPHGKNTLPGSSLDKAQQRPSSPMSNDSPAGHPFVPYVQTAPVSGLSVPHRKILCKGCTAKTWHAMDQEIPSCAHCGGALAEEDAEDYN